jgi:hypothetical protein
MPSHVPWFHDSFSFFFRKKFHQLATEKSLGKSYKRKFLGQLAKSRHISRK